MTCCVSSSSSRCLAAALALGLAAGLSACAARAPARVSRNPFDPHQPFRIALLPPEDLTGRSAPARDIAAVAERALARAGIEVVSGGLVEGFLSERRIRNTGGIDRDAALAMRDELGVSGALVTSIVLYNESAPPRFGVLMRLVAVGEEPAVAWADGFGRTGDDSPGLLGIGIVESVRKLEEEAFETLARSLASFARDPRASAAVPRCPSSGKFGPRISFRSAARPRGAGLTVAILPFVNESGRPGAGQVLALEMLRQLLAVDGVRVVEPGMLREQLLTYRVTTEGGATLPTVRLLSKVLRADLVVGGVVRDYVEQKTPEVGFSVTAIDPGSEEIVWEFVSHNLGDDSRTLFGLGTVSTADVLACSMARAAVGRVMPRSPRVKRSRRGAHGRRPSTGSAQALRTRRSKPAKRPLN